MRCPKCGAFMEDGKDTCLMCGVNVKTYIPETNPNAVFSSNNSSAFGSGNDFRTGAFNGGTMNNTQPVSKYGNVDGPFKPAPIKNEDKDIFDCFQENKGLFTMMFVFIIFGLIALVGFFYYRNRTKEIVIKPIIQNLYFEVDESFNQLSGNNSNQVQYAKSGSKGNDCTITVMVGSSTSGDHVEDYFSEVKSSLEPEKDANNQIINELDIYTPSDGSSIINGSTWYYLNMFYKASANGDPVLLKNKYMTSMDKGFYYDISLTNYSNDASCSASLDNFAKSLKFIDS